MSDTPSITKDSGNVVNHTDHNGTIEVLERDGGGIDGEGEEWKRVGMTDEGEKMSWLDYRWQKGVANGGSRTAGAFVEEWFNHLAGLPEQTLRDMLKSRSLPVAKIQAIHQHLDAIAVHDLADLQPILDGETLEAARLKGVPTSIIKKVRQLKDGGIEIELKSEERGQSLDRILNRTVGTPIQRSISATVDLSPQDRAAQVREEMRRLLGMASDTRADAPFTRESRSIGDDGGSVLPASSLPSSSQANSSLLPASSQAVTVSVTPVDNLPTQRVPYENSQIPAVTTDSSTEAALTGPMSSPSMQSMSDGLCVDGVRKFTEPLRSPVSSMAEYLEKVIVPPENEDDLIRREIEKLQRRLMLLTGNREVGPVTPSEPVTPYPENQYNEPHRVDMSDWYAVNGRLSHSERLTNPAYPLWYKHWKKEYQRRLMNVRRAAEREEPGYHKRKSEERMKKKQAKRRHYYETVIKPKRLAKKAAEKAKQSQS